MITLTVRLWTNELAGKNKVRQRHAWAGGVVHVSINKTHGIGGRSPLPFHSLAELGSVVEKACIRSGLKLHPTGKMRKYLTK